MDKSNITLSYWNTQQLHPDVVAVFSSSLPLNSTTTQAPSTILLPQQTHTTNATWVTPDIVPDYVDLNPSSLFPDTDALITDIEGLTIGIRTADCVPILLYAPDIRAIAAIHAGWKGSLHGIVDNVIDMLIAKGCNPAKIHACFGPSICPQCYEIDHTLAQQFINAGHADCISNEHTIDPLTGNVFIHHKPHLNLVKVNTLKMIDKGLLHRHIDTSSPCTRHTVTEQCQSHTHSGNTADRKSNFTKHEYPFHSWRRDPGTPHRLITTITLLSKR